MNGDMARLSAPRDGGTLRRRLISAAVILPLAAAAIGFGSWVFAALLALLGAAMCWEWARLCGAGSDAMGRLMVATAVAAPAVQVGIGSLAAIAVVAVVTAVVAVRAIGLRVGHAAILVAGLPYIVLGMMSAGWLRADPAAGLPTVLWLVGVVIATDVGAYFVGRSVGGPKLAPSISPSKTWSGLLGGMACAGLVGLVYGVLDARASAVILTACGAVLAVIAQLGDLIESRLKRHFKVKDASQLIPGHGGFLDRFDGYLTVMPATALMSATSGGSPILWQ